MTTKVQVIKSNLKQFGQFPIAEVVNPDESIWDKHYLVCIDYFSVYYVIADCEQDALDILIDYFEEQGYTGYFLDEHDLKDYYNEHADCYDDIVFAGNKGRPIGTDQLMIEQL